MDEYINREAAIKALMNDAPGQVGYSREDAADCIRYMDAADVVPVRHGRWIYHPDDLFPAESKQECSYCHEEEYVTLCNENYCPNCGAKMDGGAD